MRRVRPEDRFLTERLILRLVVPSDCTARYEAWLADEEVNRYLETRYVVQTRARIAAFVDEMIASDSSYLFAICEKDGERHVGNIKIGPIHPVHRCADVSYFLGERAVWGRGLASEAISAVSNIGFDRLDLHRVQAGVYGSNIGSCRALEKAGFRLEGRFREQLLGANGFEDHVWYGLLASERPDAVSKESR
jgi:[ribosomal protein S5]-alanine N-acetyltransferase